MLTPAAILLWLALIFCVVHIVKSQFPLWPSLLCVILRLLAFGFLWTVLTLPAQADEIDTRAATDSRARPRPCRDEKGRFMRCADVVVPTPDPPAERLEDPPPVPEQSPAPAASPEPVRAEEHFCFDDEQQPIPCPTFKLSIRAGGTFGAATDVSPDLGAAFTIRTWSELTRSDMGPKLSVRAGLGRLPDDAPAALEEAQVFTAFDGAVTLVQPLGQKILANLFARAGLASRLSTDDEPRDRLPGYFSFGVDLHTHDGDHFLQVGIGPDQRLSGDWAPTVTVEGAVKLREASGVKVWLEAAILRAIDLSAYGYATPKRDWWTAAITAGF